MAREKIEVGVLIKHDPEGVGEVVECHPDGGVTVDFAKEKGRYMGPSIVSNLRRMPDNGLEALLWNTPDDVRAWVEEAPLWLVGTVLVDMGGAAMPGEIKKKLQGRVLGESWTWNTWWDRTRPLVKASDGLTIEKSNVVRMRSGVDVYDLPVELLPPPSKRTSAAKKKPATVSQWKKWLLGEIEGPAPGRFPTKPVCNALSKWPAKTIEQALGCTIEKAEEFLASSDRSTLAMAAWLDAVVGVSIRWLDCKGRDADSHTAEKIGNLLLILTKSVKRTTGTDESLRRAGGLEELSDDWRRGFRAGFSKAIADSTDLTRNHIRELSAPLGFRGQAAMVEEFALTAFHEDESVQRVSQLDRLMDLLPDVGRVRLFQNLIARSAAGESPMKEVADYVANSRHTANASTHDRLGLQFAAAFMLNDGGRHIGQRLSNELADAIESDGDETLIGVLSQEPRRRKEVTRTNWKADMEALRSEYEAKLEEERREQSRLTELVKSYASRAASARETSKLEARLDMLGVIGEVLEMGYRSDSTAEERLADVLSVLPLALRAGDSEPIGKVGELVAYDPRLHSSTEGPSNLDRVSLVTPGVVFRGKGSADRVIVRAKVKPGMGSNK